MTFLIVTFLRITFLIMILFIMTLLTMILFIITLLIMTLLVIKILIILNIGDITCNVSVKHYSVFVRVKITHCIVI